MKTFSVIDIEKVAEEIIEIERITGRDHRTFTMGKIPNLLLFLN